MTKSWINEVEIFDFPTDDVCVVEATITMSGIQYNAVGSSKRNPMDSVDQLVGSQIATARALRNLSKAVQKAANVREANNAVRDANRRKARENGSLEAEAKKAETLAYRANALKSKKARKATAKAR